MLHNMPEDPLDLGHYNFLKIISETPPTPVQGFWQNFEN